MKKLIQGFIVFGFVGLMCGSVNGQNEEAAAKGAAEYVLPEGGKITSGSGTISNDGAGTLTVDLTSARTTIEWQSFNVGYNATVNFVFEGGNVMVDNRLMGSLVIQGICGEPNRAVWERRRTGDNYVWEPAYIQGKKNSVISGKVTVNGVAPKKGQVSMLSTDDVTGRYRSTGCAICVSRAHINNKGGLANLCAEPRGWRHGLGMPEGTERGRFQRKNSVAPPVPGEFVPQYGFPHSGVPPTKQPPPCPPGWHDEGVKRFNAQHPQGPLSRICGNHSTGEKTWICSDHAYNYDTQSGSVRLCDCKSERGLMLGGC